jgi:hypothetical protein
VLSAGSIRGAQRAVATRWEQVLVAGALVAAGLAIWLTLRAGFLTYPGWLAAQKADFVLGPISSASTGITSARRTASA